MERFYIRHRTSYISYTRKIIKKFLEKHFGDLLIEGKFSCKNVKGRNFDEYYDYPLSNQALEKFEKKLKLKIKNELKNCNKKDQRFSAKNYKEYIDSFVGPTLRKMFFEKYPKKIWGVDTKDMTPDWAPNRIKFRDKILPFYHEQYAAVGKYGTGCIYERIEKFIKKKEVNLDLMSQSQVSITMTKKLQKSKLIKKYIKLVIMKF